MSIFKGGCFSGLQAKICRFCVYAGQLASLGLCAEKLIHRARERTFRCLLRQDLVYFDLDENSAGALTSLLSTEAKVRGSDSRANHG